MGLDATNAASEKLDALFHPRDGFKSEGWNPRDGTAWGPALAPHKKAPQFMLDLFNAVSVSSGIPKSQKEILEGNIVRSFEDKGEYEMTFTHGMQCNLENKCA